MGLRNPSNRVDPSANGFHAFWRGRVVFENGRVKRFKTEREAWEFLARCGWQNHTLNRLLADSGLDFFASLVKIVHLSLLPQLWRKTNRTLILPVSVFYGEHFSSSSLRCKIRRLRGRSGAALPPNVKNGMISVCAAVALGRRQPICSRQHQQESLSRQP